MSTDHADKLLRIAQAQQPLSARELSAAGVPPRVLSRMAASGRLRRVGRGSTPASKPHQRPPVGDRGNQASPESRGVPALGT